MTPDVFTWLWDNALALLAIAAAIVTVASLIAALTPSPKDDEFWIKVRGIVEVLALNVGNAKVGKAAKPTSDGDMAASAGVVAPDPRPPYSAV